MKHLVLILLCVFPYHVSSLELSSTNIVKDASFNGKNLEIHGTMEPQTNVAIVISGPAEKYKIIKKEKLGIVWVNAKSYYIENQASFFKVVSSQPIHTIASNTLIQNLNLEFDESNFRIKEKHNPITHAELYEAFKDYKVAQKEYTEFESLFPILNSSKYTTSVFLPPQIRSGEYNVVEYTFNNAGVLLNLQQRYFSVVQTGYSEKLKNLSAKYPILYSILAVFMAVIIGSFTAFLFNYQNASKNQKRHRY